MQHLHRQRAFSERTFGPGARTKGVIDHIRKELREIEAAPTDISEWIDVVLLALDGAWRSGASPEAIVAALLMKQTRNEARTWPDWRTADPNKAIEHDRSGEAPAEVGKLAGAIAFLDGAAVMLGRGEMPAPGSPYAAKWWQAHAVALSALRAQPHAPEDGQPVTGMRVHLVRSKAFGDLAIRHWASIGGLTEGEHVLYVSPASALREVVEALKHYGCSCEPGHCAMSADDTDTPVDEQMCGHRASKALIALEGGAA